MKKTEDIKEYHRQRYLNNKELILKKHKQHREKNKDKINNTRLIRVFGISLADYNKMFEDQKGCCKICGKSQEELKEKKALAIDHCHTTGKVRGLLCTYCNVGLGIYEKNKHKYEKYLGLTVEVVL